MNRLNRKLFTIIYLILFVTFFSCERNVLDDSIDAELVNPTELTFDFTVAVPQYNQVETRQGRTQDLSTLRLLIFDEENKFVYSRVAILKKVTSANGSSFYPDNTANPTDVYTYSVRLISSIKKRTVHFIANYDWSNFEQDYFLVGMDAGQVVGALATSEEVFWRAKSYEKITPDIFTKQTVKLLSNRAQIEVENNSSNFKLTGYAVYNVYNKGSVAPFQWNEKDLGAFPINPSEATIPADAKLDKKINFSTTPIHVFEQENRGDNLVSILIKGKYNNASKESYYKLDFKRLDNKTGLPILYPILRNYGYKIVLNKITVAGYSTVEEAIKQPASNNVYGSLELEEFYKVSDGTNLLEVEELNKMLVSKGQLFKSKVTFSKGIKNVKYYPSWSDNDPYLEKIRIYSWKNPEEGHFEFALEKVPTDRYLNYTIDIVGKVQEGYFITRRVKILVRQPYKFNASLKPQSTKDFYLLSFDVPKTLSKSAFPLDILIETREMSPRSNKNMVIVYKNGTYYYKYVLSESDLGKRIEIPFKKITRDSEKVINVKLVSDYYVTASLKHSK